MTNYENLILELATQELEKMRGGILNGLKVLQSLFIWIFYLFSLFARHLDS